MLQTGGLAAALCPLLRRMATDPVVPVTTWHCPDCHPLSPGSASTFLWWWNVLVEYRRHHTLQAAAFLDGIVELTIPVC